MYKKEIEQVQKSEQVISNTLLLLQDTIKQLSRGINTLPAAKKARHRSAAKKQIIETVKKHLA